MKRNPRPRTFPLLALAVLALLWAPSGAVAQENPLVARWELDLGSVFASLDTDLRADGSRGDRGTQLDVEEALDLDSSKTLLRLNVAYRFKPRHQVRVGYFEHSRTGERAIPFEIELRDVVFPVEVVVDSRYDFSFSNLRYNWWLVANEKRAFSLIFGVARWEIDFALSAGEGRLQETLDANVGLDVPVPEIGGEFRTKLGSKVLFRAALSGLVFDVGDESGTVVDTSLRFDYQFSRNVGLGISLLLVRADVEQDARSFLGDYKLSNSGIELYLPIRFN